MALRKGSWNARRTKDVEMHTVHSNSRAIVNSPMTNKCIADEPIGEASIRVLVVLLGKLLALAIAYQFVSLDTVRYYLTSN